MKSLFCDLEEENCSQRLIVVNSPLRIGTSSTFIVYFYDRNFLVSVFFKGKKLFQLTKAERQDISWLI